MLRIVASALFLIGVFIILVVAQARADWNEYRFDTPIEERECVVRHTDGSLTKEYCHIPAPPVQERPVLPKVKKMKKPDALENLEEL